MTMMLETPANWTAMRFGDRIEATANGPGGFDLIEKRRAARIDEMERHRV